MSENTREITLDEAKKLYNSSEESKVFLLSKFTKDELEGNIIPSQEEFNKFFEETIFSLIDHSKTKFLDSCGNVSKTPTSRIELRNAYDNWLFDYDYNAKTPHFWYSFNQMYIHYIHYIHKFSFHDVDSLIKSTVEKHFNLRDVQPLKDVEVPFLCFEKQSHWYGVPHL